MSLDVKIGPALKKVLGFLGKPDDISNTQREWRLKVGTSGNWTEISQAILYNPTRDTVFALGYRNKGSEDFQGPIIAQPSGGGEVCLLYFWDPGEVLWIGAIREERPNMGGRHFCAIGGMNELKLSRDEALAAELSEEAGLGASFKPKVIQGLPVCVDRLFFLADSSKGEGVRYSGLEIPLESIELDKHRYLRAHFKAGVSSHQKEAEITFMPWYELIAQSPDGILVAGCARLLAHLRDKHHD